MRLLLLKRKMLVILTIAAIIVTSLVFVNAVTVVKAAAGANLNDAIETQLEKEVLGTFTLDSKPRYYTFYLNENTPVQIDMTAYSSKQEIDRHTTG